MRTMRQMRLAKVCTCPPFARVILENAEGAAQLVLRPRPIKAMILAHEMEETGCPGVTVYRLVHELVRELGGELSEAIIDASEEGTPVGVLVLQRGNREIRHYCHPVDAIGLSLRTQIPLYATSEALRLGGWEDIERWLSTVRPEDFR